jgi:hypothetical protein
MYKKKRKKKCTKPQDASRGPVTAAAVSVVEIEWCWRRWVLLLSRRRVVVHRGCRCDVAAMCYGGGGSHTRSREVAVCRCGMWMQGIAGCQ